MKKLLVLGSIFLLLIAFYFGQIAYMGVLNEKLFKLQTSQNEFLTFTETSFEKGFFTSNARFKAKIKADQYPLNQLSLSEAQELLSVEATVLFKNNIFAKNNAIMHFQSPIFDLIEELTNGDIKARDLIIIKADLSLLGNVTVRAEVADLSYEEDYGSFKLTGLKSKGEFDLQGLMKKSSFELSGFNYTESSSFIPFNFDLKELFYQEDYGKGVRLKDYLVGIVESKGALSVKSIELMDLQLDGIKTSFESFLSKDDDKLLNANASIDINSINSSLANINLNKFKSEFELRNVSSQFLQDFYEQDINKLDTKDLAQNFFQSGASLSLNTLEFSSKDDKFNSKGELRGTNEGYKLSYEAQSSAVISEILPPLVLFGLNRFFVEKEGRYSLSLNLETDFKDYKLNVNGEELSFGFDEVEDEALVDELFDDEVLLDDEAILEDEDYQPPLIELP
ncbi:DUF945 family protein [Campylobacter troglodytis]|uniref:DUF945 family protein n=1 Tax=Campylobacter troglodytis TaxID=654363 RepID=UPI001157BC8D|nr:DUF945 family protein [Campylobacter troglodytis]TQR60636.1 hypothetical protein DMC01_04730 [Campylobacter troglodytis]